MSCIVSNQIYFDKRNHEIYVIHTRPFIKNHECILIMNASKKTEYIDILLSYKCCELNKSLITVNTDNLEILDFIKMLGYISIKIFSWKNNKLIYLDSRII